MKIVTSLDCFCVIFRLVVCISFYFQKNKKREKRKQGHETWPELAFTVSSFSLEIEKEEVEVNTSSLAVCLDL